VLVTVAVGWMHSPDGPLMITLSDSFFLNVDGGLTKRPQ
jgi:hypothetical protein